MADPAPTRPAPSPPTLTLVTVHGEWPIVMPEMKLKLRARLPGASAFDDAAAGLRSARAAGASAGDLLAPAMASSWLVNSALPSPIFQRWLSAPLRARWEKLVALIEGDGTPWSSRTPSDRTAIDEEIAALIAAGKGTSLGGMSKVLATLSTEPVPLMPDAALAFVLRAMPVPQEADAQTAPPKHFGAMMDRLAASEARDPEALAALIARAAPTLRPRDVIDRLVWFDSMGYRHFKNDQGGWYWVRSESLEGVVFVPGAAPENARPGACIDVPGEDEFSSRAHEALKSALRQHE